MRILRRLKEILIFTGFAFLVFECMLVILACFAGGLPECKTAAEVIRILLPRIPGIVFYSAFFCMMLQIVWKGRHQPYACHLLAGIAVIGIPGWIPDQLSWIMCQFGH